MFADQSRGPAGSTRSTTASLPAGSAVTEQPAAATTSPAICAGSAGTPRGPHCRSQRLGRRIERTQRILLDSLQRRSVRGLGGQIRPHPRIQRPHKLLMKRAGLQVNRVKLLTLPRKVRRHRRRYLIGAGSHRPVVQPAAARRAAFSSEPDRLPPTAVSREARSEVTPRPPSRRRPTHVGIRRNQLRVLARRKILAHQR